jgi:hypothetical protein
VTTCESGYAGRKADRILVTTAALGDYYLLRFPPGTQIPPHSDPVKTGRHYRLNVIVKRSPRGGDFVCTEPIFETSRIKLFRPDVCTHSVTKVEGGSRYVLSIRWVLK